MSDDQPGDDQPGDDQPGDDQTGDGGDQARVGIVVVSHSEPLARAAVDLAAQMLPDGVRGVAVAAGVDDPDAPGGAGFGTDAVRVKEAIESVESPAGVLVLVDLGSALLSTDLALEMLEDPDAAERVRVSPGPLVEGLVVAAVAAAGGAGLADVAAQARGALAAKTEHLDDGADDAHHDGADADDGGGASGEDTDGPVVTGSFTVTAAQGLHARPAARLVGALGDLDARVELTNRTTGTGPVEGDSMLYVATLDARHGHEVDVRAVGPDAQAAVDRLEALAAEAFGDHPGGSS